MEICCLLGNHRNVCLYIYDGLRRGTGRDDSLSGKHDHDYRKFAHNSGSESSASSTQPSQSISQQTSQQIGQESTSFSKQSSTTAATSKSTVSTNRKPTATSKPPAAVAPSKSLMVGYYTGWSAGTGYTPDKIPANKLTHIPYAFAKIDPKTLTITLADPVTDRRNFEKLRQLKTKHPHLKTLISVGGWDYSRYFSDAAATANSRKSLCAKLRGFYSGTWI